MTQLISTSVLRLCGLVVAGATTTLAQTSTPTKPPAATPAPAGTPASTAAAPSAGFRADFLKHWDYLEKRFVDLAQAVPQEKYTWHPEGARAFSEVFLHVASANYGFMGFLGVPVPAGIDRRTYEKSTTERPKVVENLKHSFDHVRQAVLKMSDADLDKSAKLFGRDSNYREVLFTLVTHQPEHLGQLIAYSRVNGIVPPWAAERQAQQQKQKERPKE